MTSERRSPMRRLVRLLAALLAVVALAYAVIGVLRRRSATGGTGPSDWPPLDDIGGAATGAASTPRGDGASTQDAAPDGGEAPDPTPLLDGDRPWLESDDGTCPATHPVKGKLSSGIYHVPGGLNYDRTLADRCYRTPDDASDDGLRASKR